MYNFNPYSYNALPVNSIDEAKNSAIDLSGKPVFYFNRVKNEIYLKQFDANTAKTYFGKYVFSEMPVEKPKQDEIEELKAQIADLYKLISVKENDKEIKDLKPKKEKAAKDDE